MTIARRSFIKGAGGFALASGAGFGLAAPAIAQEKWPNKPIRFIVPLAPGGAIDFVARQCGTVLSQSLGQQIVVENRTGAGGTIGMDSAWKATPDGYTFLITNDNAASAPHILKLDHDYTKVLLPVIDIAHQPQVFAVHPTLGVNSVKEYVENAKAHPGVGFASSGVGSNQHVIGEWFAKEAGLKMEHVPPYRGIGAGRRLTDLLAGHVKSAFLGPTALINHHTRRLDQDHRAKRRQACADAHRHPDAGGVRLQGRAGRLVRLLRAAGHARRAGSSRLNAADRRRRWPIRSCWRTSQKVRLRPSAARRRRSANWRRRISEEIRHGWCK